MSTQTSNPLLSEEETYFLNKELHRYSVIENNFINEGLLRAGNWLIMNTINGLEDILDFIIKGEGGFVNDPTDRGGPTNFGITKDSYSAYTGRPKELITIAEIRAIKEDTAKEIYKTLYIEKPGYDIIKNPVIQCIMADMSVLHGPRRATMMLQHTINALMGIYTVKVDGKFGPKTNAALEKMLEEKGLRKVRQEIYEQVYIRIHQIIRYNPSQIKFRKGWLNRAKKYLDPKDKERLDTRRVHRVAFEVPKKGE